MWNCLWKKKKTNWRLWYLYFDDWYFYIFIKFKKWDQVDFYTIFFSTELKQFEIVDKFSLSLVQLLSSLYTVSNVIKVQTPRCSSYKIRDD